MLPPGTQTAVLRLQHFAILALWDWLPLFRDPRGLGSASTRSSYGISDNESPWDHYSKEGVLSRRTWRLADLGAKKSILLAGLAGGVCRRTW
jgi:hypothetical protein